MGETANNNSLVLPAISATKPNINVPKYIHTAPSESSGMLVISFDQKNDLWCLVSERDLK